MKKRLIVLILVLAVSMLGGCSAEESTNASADVAVSTTKMEETVKEDTDTVQTVDKVSEATDEVKSEEMVVEEAVEVNSTSEVAETSAPVVEEFAFLYEQSGDGIIINGVNDITVTELVIPKEIDGHKVIGIATNAFRDCLNVDTITIDPTVDTNWKNGFVLENIKKLIILDGITIIEKDLFKSMSSLEYIIIPMTVTKINDFAFYYCESLKEIYIPEGVMLISETAFINCVKLESIKVDENNLFYTSKGDDSTECNAIIDTQQQKLLRGCGTTLIPKTVTTLGAYSFSTCTFNKFVIPDNITVVDENAFSNATITTLNAPVTLLDSLNQLSVENYVFYGDTSGIERIDFSKNQYVKNIVLPESVPEGTSAGFSQCSSLNSVNVPEGVTVLKGGAFMGCSSLKNVTIPSSVKEIGGVTFSNCSSLESIVIPEGIQTIGMSAFEGCTSLTSVVIPESVTTIETYTFDGCSSLVDITIPNGVRNIYGKAFEGCSSLTSLVFPESLETFLPDAINKCSSLTSITFLGYTEVPDWDFAGCDNLTIIYAYADSPAAQWAKNHNYRVMDPQ